MREKQNGDWFVYEGNYFKGEKHGLGTYCAVRKTGLKEGEKELFYDGMWHFGSRTGYTIEFKGKSIKQEEFSSCSNQSF